MPYRIVGLWVCACVLVSGAAFARNDKAELFFVKAAARNAGERNRITDLGIAIDGVLSDAVTAIVTARELQALRKAGIAIEVTRMPERDFPATDAAFHNYAEMNAALDKIATEHPAIAQRITIGKSLEGRPLVGIRLSSNPVQDSLPTAVFVGCHHAREHLSVEMPLMLAKHLAANYQRDRRIRGILDTREIWIVPMVNPDGAEYDIAAGSYKYWRKNRSKNSDGTAGVDLNRNYGGPNFGGEGSSSSPSSDIYHGPHAFSEPESAAVRDFVRARRKATVLLTYHTFSELVLWPWGHTNDVISNSADRQVFETMGKKMATWNLYTPQKSSQLYVTSGDTTDWAYDELKIFAFTFELSPKSMFQGGFYPGAKAIEPTFKANVEPALYMMELAENPYVALRE